MDNKLEIKSFYIPLIYFFAALFMEAGMFVALNFGFYPKYVLFNIAVMLVFFGIIFICYNFKIQMIVSLVLLTVQLVLSFINVTIYAIYGDLSDLFGSGIGWRIVAFPSDKTTALTCGNRVSGCRSDLWTLLPGCHWSAWTGL